MCEYWYIKRGQKHFKMAAFREGKLARKKDGQLQSKVVKSKMENPLDSRKKTVEW